MNVSTATTGPVYPALQSVMSIMDIRSELTADS